MDDIEKRLSVLDEAIPANSKIKELDGKTRIDIIGQIINDVPIALIRRHYAEIHPQITEQQLRRVKKHVIPLWNYKTEPRILFQNRKAGLEDTLDKMEYLLDQEFKRIIQQIEVEIEEGDELEPSKYVDADVVREHLMQMLKEYHAGTINEVDKKVLMSMMVKKKPNELLFKEIQAFQKMMTEYIKQRKELGDPDMTLDAVQKEAKLIDLKDEDEKKRVRKALKERLKGITDGKKG